MNFLFPLFLIAGAAIAIPVIIHLFNFRKYKTIEFSDTRLLEQIKITSQKSRKVQNWWLLLSRILFLAALVLAFAQPYLGTQKDTSRQLKLIYIDNSQSMADNLGGQRQLLQNAIDDAKGIINALSEHQQYILLSNNNIYASRPIGKSQVMEALQQLKVSAKTVSLKQINQAVNNALSDNNAENAEVYIFSDLQKSTLFREALDTVAATAHYIIRPQLHRQSANLYFDTAYFVNPVIDTRQENPLVVKISKSNTTETIQSQVQVWVNGQARAAKNINFTNDSTWTDTIALMVNTPGWHKILLTVKDAPIQFDDTFRITAKTNANLAVLNLNDGSSSPYLQAALSPANGFITRNAPLNAGSAGEWPDNNLVILQNIQQLSPELTDAVKKGLQNGQSFFLIPGNISNIASFNQQLNKIAPINFAAADTASTQIGAVQTEHALLKDVIATMPQNVQLPTVLRHYPISAGLSANQQSILSLKNGQPFLAQYSIDNGALYIIASSLEERSGNFVLSNLFMPLLYKMCAVSGAQSIYAINANSNQPVFIPNQSANRTVFKATGPDAEVIPAQNAYGNGTNIFLGKAIDQAGFYTLKNESVADSTLVAVNANTLESELEAATKEALEQQLKPAKLSWEQSGAPMVSSATGNNTDLWKWLVTIALLALIIETYFLLKRPGKTAAQQTETI
ncbi:MAG: BatA domain-containing protein [Taibaiella sp.]|nr:BatA domain-containing protein [Taibaiella sp.]